MRSKKVIAALSAITMLGSLATAVPMSASAATTVTTDEKIELTNYVKLDISSCVAYKYYNGSSPKTSSSTSDISNLFDGNTTTTVGGQNQSGYVIDLGENHAPITRITLKGFTTTTTYICMAPSSYTYDTAWDNKVDVVRTNNTNQTNGTKESYTYDENNKPNSETTFTVKETVKNYRWLIVQDWSNWWSLGELEVYTSPQYVGVVRDVNETYTPQTSRTCDSNGFSITNIYSFENYNASNLFDNDINSKCYLWRDTYFDKDILIDLGKDTEINKLVLKQVRQSTRFAYGSNSASTVSQSAKTVNLPYGYRLNDSYTNGSVQNGTSVTFGTKTNEYWDTVTISGITGGIRYLLLDPNGTGSDVYELEAYKTITSTTYEVSTGSGIIADTSAGLSEGDTVNITATPANMVTGSLRVHNTSFSVDNGSARVSVANNAFTMPASDVDITCLVDDGTTTIIGTADRYYARAADSMNMSFNVTIPEGKQVASAALYIPYKTHNYNRNEMVLKYGDAVVKTLENSDKTLNQYDIQGVDVTSYIVNGTNTFTVTNSHSSGIDYFSADAAPTSDKIPRLVLTFEDKPVIKSAAIVKHNDADYITYQTGTDGSKAAGFFAELTATGGTSIEKLGVNVDGTDRGSQYLSSDGKTHTTLTGGTAYIPVIVKNVTSENTITLYVE